MTRARPDRQPDSRAAPRADGDGAVFPVVEERVGVGKEETETGLVRVRRVSGEERRDVDVPLEHRRARVERVSVNRTVEDGSPAPEPRREGDTLIVPVLEEEVVVQKRLVVREELRITTEVEHETRRETVGLRREDVEVERLPPEGSAGGTPATR